MSDTLIAAARAALAAAGDGRNHTVGAAILTSTGVVVTGVNLYHFTGGPCAEVVALARAVTEVAGAPQRIVAVGDTDRGVVAPCGRCRQVLLDYCPDVRIVLPGGRDATPRDLLPEAYVLAEHA